MCVLKQQLAFALIQPLDLVLWSKRQIYFSPPKRKHIACCNVRVCGYFYISVRLKIPKQDLGFYCTQTQTKKIIPASRCKRLSCWKSLKVSSIGNLQSYFMQLLTAEPHFQHTSYQKKIKVLFLYLRLQHTMVVVIGFMIKRLKSSQERRIEKNRLVTKSSSLLSHENILQNSSNELRNFHHVASFFFVVFFAVVPTAFIRKPVQTLAC